MELAGAQIEDGFSELQPHRSWRIPRDASPLWGLRPPLVRHLSEKGRLPSSRAGEPTPRRPAPGLTCAVPTWKLTLEYDGTRYRGWQTQKNADRTVQAMLGRAAQELRGADASVGGAGRTDAGVHALAQVAHLRARRSLPEADLAWGLNEKDRK